MKFKTLGCIVVTVLIIGMYMVVCYGPQLGIVHPINRSNDLQSQTIDFVDHNAVATFPFDNNSIIWLDDHNEAYNINWSG